MSYDENAILDTIEKASKTAVNISTIKLVHNFFYQAVPVGGIGSGTIIDAEGLILTNNHVGGGSLTKFLRSGLIRLTQNQIEEILRKTKVIAVVGVSKEPGKDSHKVGAYLKQNGYRIIPVNPFAEEVLGEKSYPSLLDIPNEIQKTIDVIDVFRPSKDVPPIVEQAIQLKKLHGKPLVVWMQLGIVNEQAAEAARNAGLMVVMDKCMMIEHDRLTKKSN